MAKPSRFTVAALVAGVTLGMALVASPASAAGRDGVTNAGEFVFYYGTGCTGSLSDFTASKSNLAGYTYLSSGAGQGTAVKNNSKCAANFNYDHNARVYYNSYCAGVDDLIPIRTYVDLTDTFTENASFRFLGTTFDCSV